MFKTNSKFLFFLFISDFDVKLVLLEPSKLAKAEKLGIAIIDENRFLELII